MGSAFKNFWLATVAGLLGSMASLLVAYVAGSIAILVHTGEVLPTLLAMGTVLPLMLLFVILPLTLVASGPTALILICFARLKYLVLMGALVGLIAVEIVFAILAAWVFNPAPGDIFQLAANPIVAGSYGALLGVIVALLIRRLVSS
jgi:hypothetical protein